MAFSAAMVDNFKEAFACFDIAGHGMCLERANAVIRGCPVVAAAYRPVLRPPRHPAVEFAQSAVVCSTRAHVFGGRGKDENDRRRVSCVRALRTGRIGFYFIDPKKEETWKEAPVSAMKLFSLPPCQFSPIFHMELM